MLFTETHGSRKAFSKAPAVIRLKDTYFLYYSSYYADGEREALGIGVASSPDMEHWTTVGRIPPTQECEKNGIGAPAARSQRLAVEEFRTVRDAQVALTLRVDGVEVEPVGHVVRGEQIARAVEEHDPGTPLGCGQSG